MSYKSIVLFFFSYLFISCASDDDIFKEIRALNETRSTWQRSQLKNYRINERISCFCGGLLEWDVYVKEGAKERVEFDELHLPSHQTYNDIFDNAKTVEDAFDFIEELIYQNVASLLVEYNNEYGFPSLISIDYYADTTDDEIGYLYTDFELID